MPAPSSVEIVAEDNAYFLYYLNDKSEPMTDTWRQTLDDAKAQAAYEFGLRDEDWERIE